MRNDDEVNLVILGAPGCAERIRSALGVEVSSETPGYKTIYKIKLAQSTDPDTSQGEFLDWCGLLFEKPSELKQLLSSGLEGYLECALKSDDTYIDSKAIKRLAELDLDVSVWFKSPEPKKFPALSDYLLEIPEPLWFYSQLDEAAFYNGILSLAPVLSLITRPGRPLEEQPNRIILQLDQPVMDDYSLRDLIGLMFRYSLDMSSLRSQCREQNVGWIKNPECYWYKSIFGVTDV